MIMPEQKPHRSKQDVGTPDDFKAALEERFGKITFDLAAHKANKICDKYFAPKELSAIYEHGITNDDDLLVELIEAGANYYNARAKIEQAAIEAKVLYDNGLKKPKVKFLVINTDQDHSGLDSLSQDWRQITGGNSFLNPEYSNIEPWAKKCAETFGVFDQNYKGPSIVDINPILLLIPAAVGSNYFKDYIDYKAAVKFLSPRMTFKGHKDPYPKDLILAVYGMGATGYECWRWK